MPLNYIQETLVVTRWNPHGTYYNGLYWTNEGLNADDVNASNTVITIIQDGVKYNCVFNRKDGDKGFIFNAEIGSAVNTSGSYTLIIEIIVGNTIYTLNVDLVNGRA